jgi:hypothetical protein
MLVEPKDGYLIKYRLMGELESKGEIYRETEREIKSWREKWRVRERERE